MSDAQIDSMKLAIANKDFAQFVRLLELTPDLWNSGSKPFQESEHSRVTLLHKLTTERFAIGLQWYLNRCWQTVTKEDAHESLVSCMTHGTSTMCTRVLLEAATEEKPKFVSKRAVFYLANFTGLYDISERVANIPTFRTDSRLRVRFQDQPVRAWALPLHDAVAHHQVTIVEILIAERGAAVDKESTEQITPLAIAYVTWSTPTWSCNYCVMGPIRTSLCSSKVKCKTCCLK